MGGAYGYEKKNFELSKDIAGKLYNDVKDNPCDRIVTIAGVVNCRFRLHRNKCGTSLDFASRSLQIVLILLTDPLNLMGCTTNKPNFRIPIIQR